jgi:protein SCO1/2
MHPRMIGLTGSASEIDAVSKSWRNYYRLNDQQDKENYLVDHMTNTYLILPGAGTVDVFARDLPAQELADRIACFIGAAG